MVNLKLIKTYPYGGHNFTIYEIPRELRDKYQGKFLLSQGIFGSWFIKNHETEDALKNINPYYYEGFFNTVEDIDKAMEEIMKEYNSWR